MYHNSATTPHPRANERQGADSNGAIWSVVETCIAVVSACLPTLKPLINKPANTTSVRERYEASYTLKNSDNSNSTKMSTLKSPRSYNTPAITKEAEEQRAFARLDDDL